MLEMPVYTGIFLKNSFYRFDNQDAQQLVRIHVFPAISG